ncbi:hypothetical protein AVEN_27573-1 [Araneus ventricosus]|uniref:Uncharacterized protein n=1 Tax=Araneus ventricosus TaxID=182803 RepID=A0A4Y2W1I5_ARAVE|nr:hypothetical protein AVEN_27573-1 [Araneus ventricosus]
MLPQRVGEMASQVGRVQLSLPTTAHFSAPEGNVTAEGGRNGHPDWESPIILANHSPFQRALRECYRRGWEKWPPRLGESNYPCQPQPISVRLKGMLQRGWEKWPPRLGESNSCRLLEETPGFKETRRKNVSSGLKS